jgi:hypothetical protein
VRREPEAEQWRRDLLLGDLRVLAVPPLDLEAVGEVPDDLVRHRRHAHLVQGGVVVEGLHEDAEALLPRVLAEVRAPCPLARGVNQRRDLHHTKSEPPSTLTFAPVT